MNGISLPKAEKTTWSQCAATAALSKIKQITIYVFIGNGLKHQTQNGTYVTVFAFQQILYNNTNPAINIGTIIPSPTSTATVSSLRDVHTGLSENYRPYQHLI
jgi:hypothetical protein